MVDCARTMHKIIKHAPENAKITIIVRRLPHAQVYAVTRTEQREDVGIVCQGTTAEVGCVGVMYWCVSWINTMDDY